jgi:hypothetical protein
MQARLNNRARTYLVYQTLNLGLQHKLVIVTVDRVIIVALHVDFMMPVNNFCMHDCLWPH